jgi:hypothetical protein
MQKAKPAKFKKIVGDLMADHSDLVARVQEDDKKYEVTDMQKVIDEYNEWYEQNSTLEGSR